MLKIVLISTYELGRQPFGLASPAAWLRQNGFEVTCMDAAVSPLSAETIGQADLIAFYLPMHTATRLAVKYISRIRQLHDQAHLCCYGLYAPLNEAYLRRLGVGTILGGEFEEGLLRLCSRLQNEENPQAVSLQSEPVISLARQQFLLPERWDLPDLSKYAHLFWKNHQTRTIGYVEATRGCKHLCTHCPVVPVYEGKFRVVQQNIVLADIRQQVAAGAEHITFGDPDFFNGIGHALPLVQALHEEFPQLTYDVTIKIEHLLIHAQSLVLLKKTGCVMVTSAVESVDDHVLSIFNKNHTFEDFTQVVHWFRELGLALNPTFIPFTPWTTLEGYQKLLVSLHHLGLVDQVAPIQLAIRLLLPEGSKLLELSELQKYAGNFNEESLAYQWHHPDEQVEECYHEILELVTEGTAHHASRQEIFTTLWDCVNRKLDCFPTLPPYLPPHVSFPYLNEPWYC